MGLAIEDTYSTPNILGPFFIYALDSFDGIKHSNTLIFIGGEGYFLGDTNVSNAKPLKTISPVEKFIRYLLTRQDIPLKKLVTNALLLSSG